MSAWMRTSAPSENPTQAGQVPPRRAVSSAGSRRPDGPVGPPSGAGDPRAYVHRAVERRGGVVPDDTQHGDRRSAGCTQGGVPHSAHLALHRTGSGLPGQVFSRSSDHQHGRSGVLPRRASEAVTCAGLDGVVPIARFARRFPTPDGREARNTCPTGRSWLAPGRDGQDAVLRSRGSGRDACRPRQLARVAFSRPAMPCDGRIRTNKSGRVRPGPSVMVCRGTWRCDQPPATRRIPVGRSRSSLWTASRRWSDGCASGSVSPAVRARSWTSGSVRRANARGWGARPSAAC